MVLGPGSITVSSKSGAVALLDTLGSAACSLIYRAHLHLDIKQLLHLARKADDAYGFANDCGVCR